MIDCSRYGCYKITARPSSQRPDAMIGADIMVVQPVVYHGPGVAVISGAEHSGAGRPCIKISLSIEDDRFDGPSEWAIGRPPELRLRYRYGTEYNKSGEQRRDRAKPHNTVIEYHIEQHGNRGK